VGFLRRIRRQKNDATASDDPLEVPAKSEPDSKRPKTPRNPNPNEQSSMWPDLWAEHRYGPHRRGR